MNRFEIRDILSTHKEHFRVLPDRARNALCEIIYAIDGEEKDKHKATVAALHAEDEAAKKKKKESPAESVTVGKVAKNKSKKKSK